MKTAEERREYDRQYREDNIDRVREYARKYRSEQSRKKRLAAPDFVDYRSMFVRENAAKVHRDDVFQRWYRTPTKDTPEHVSLIMFAIGTR